MSMTGGAQQPRGEFAFAEATLERAKAIIGRYPENRQASAVVPLLDLAQRQNAGWLCPEAIEYVAELLEMAPIRVHEVASFYSMLNLKPGTKEHYLEFVESKYPHLTADYGRLFQRAYAPAWLQTDMKRRVALVTADFGMAGRPDRAGREPAEPQQLGLAMA